MESKINAFLRSDEGKKKIAEAKRKALLEGQRFGQSGGSFSEQDAYKAADKQRAILLRHLSQVGLGSITADDIIIDKPVIDNEGNISIGLRFHPDSVYRPSLVPEKYAGIENIVLHFTHGWSARGAVYGHWESAGIDTWSRASYSGDDFMQHAVDDFNALGIGVAELDGKYHT